MPDNRAAKIDRGATWLAESEKIVVFTGAGISTESGIPDFRGPDGVWTRRDKGLPPPKWKTPPDKVKPNAGHIAIVKLQNAGKLKFLISQNVDNLHLASGIRPELIAELHGNSEIMKCIVCDKRYTKREIGWDDKIHGKGYRTEKPKSNQPRCACGGRIISSIVNFGDPMPERELALAREHSSDCDLFVVLGSSLVVSPANYFPMLALEAGAKLIIVNKGETPIDNRAHLRFFEPIGEVFVPMVEKALAN